MSVASLSRSLVRCARGPSLTRVHGIVGRVSQPRALPALSLLRSTPTLSLRKLATSAAECKFPGAPHATYTDSFEIAKDSRVIPVYRVMDESGTIVNKNFKNQLSDETLLKMYKDMVTLNVMDQVFYDAQRQGRISFYMTSNGEEGATVASAAGLHASDVIYSQYREAGVFMWRGFTLAQFADQCFSNSHDLGKGRQMPVHYGSADLNIQTISSPLTTQLPHAAGAAYALKLANEKRIVVVYFGEGAASEGDFHAAMNFASTLACPMIFFCRNNGYAISTPTQDQYHGDGIASRAIGYGMHFIRVDGNDVFAVQQATAEARSIALSKQVPVLIEAMSYRAGHHSTSDDSTRYRTVAEINQWQSDNNPIIRLRMFLEKRNVWDSAKELELQQACRKEVLSQLTRAEIEKKPAADELFTDVYDHPLPHLQRQQAELKAHLDKYHDKYDLSVFAPPKSA